MACRQAGFLGSCMDTLMIRIIRGFVPVFLRLSEGTSSYGASLLVHYQSRDTTLGKEPPSLLVILSGAKNPLIRAQVAAPAGILRHRNFSG